MLFKGSLRLNAVVCVDVSHVRTDPSNSDNSSSCSGFGPEKKGASMAPVHAKEMKAGIILDSDYIYQAGTGFPMQPIQSSQSGSCAWGIRGFCPRRFWCLCRWSPQEIERFPQDTRPRKTQSMESA